MKEVLAVMPFSTDWADTVWDGLLQIMTKDNAKEIKISRVDIKKTSADYLDEKIEEENKSAGIILADITGNNPNVLLEVGIALALKTPLILITQDRHSVPTHLKGRIVEEYNPSDADLFDRFTTMLLLRIREKIKLVESEIREKRALDVYPVECYSTRRLAKIEHYFHKAKVRVDILTTNLDFLFEEYGESDRTYFDDLQEALDLDNSKLRIRMLTLDPESDFASKRGNQLGYAPALFRETLRQALENTKKVALGYPTGKFEVRTYDDFPNQIMFRIDNDIFHCVVAQPTQSRNHLTMKLDRRYEAVDRSFMTHFQQIWGKGQQA